MNNDRIELYTDKNHPQLNANVNYLHLSQIQTLDNASCLDIEVNNCLDYFLERNEILQTLVNKLRYNGTIKINGIDLEDVAYHTTTGRITIEQSQNLLYTGKTLTSTCEIITNQLKMYGLTIVDSGIDNHNYFITAKRNLTK